MSKTKNEDLRAPPGRPRDPEIEPRIKRAAMEILADRGFAGLTVESICSRACVPRSTFYRRWTNAQDTLLDALDERMVDETLPDRGDVVSDLVAYTIRFIDILRDPVYAACYFYIFAETRLNPEFRAKALKGFGDRRGRSRELIERAVKRGELRAHIRPDILLDSVMGLAMVWSGSPIPPLEAELSLLIGRLIGPDLRT